MDSAYGSPLMEMYESYIRERRGDAAEHRNDDCQCADVAVISSQAILLQSGAH